MNKYIALFLLFTMFGCQTANKSSDLYRNFSELKANEDPSAYKIDSKKRNAEVLVLAPHGGNIEFGTSTLAKSLAGKSWSYYSFEGKLESGNSRLHITSSNFDEPTAIQLATESEICLSLHGYKSKPGDANICFGGRNDSLGERLHLRLLKLGIQNSQEFNACGRFYGQSETNIANRCQLEGVQMELSREFREKLVKSRKLRRKFERAIRQVVADYLKEAHQ